MNIDVNILPAFRAVESELASVVVRLEVALDLDLREAMRA